MQRARGDRGVTDGRFRAEASTREVRPVTVTEDFAEDVAVIHDPEVRSALHVEQHGIDFIPESERWAKPRDVGGMWAGVSSAFDP